MPCNHFIMTNRNSNAVPCEPSRGKIELTVNCSCLGNGEEEKKRGKRGDRQESKWREGKTRGGFGLLQFWQRFWTLGAPAVSQRSSGFSSFKLMTLTQRSNTDALWPCMTQQHKNTLHTCEMRHGRPQVSATRKTITHVCQHTFNRTRGRQCNVSLLRS